MKSGQFACSHSSATHAVCPGAAVSFSYEPIKQQMIAALNKFWKMTTNVIGTCNLTFSSINCGLRRAWSEDEMD
jgi:hypothetical protein